MSEELKGRELGWDDEIEKGADYVLLPEGEYDFTIESFERGRFEGSDKAPACPRAELKVKVETPEGVCLMNESLLLYDRMQWKLAEFFLSIGAEEVNGKVKMKANFQKTLNLLLTAEIDNEEWKPILESLGVECTLESALLMAQIKAALDGDTQAAKFVAQYSGQSNRAEEDLENKKAMD